MKRALAAIDRPVGRRHRTGAVALASLVLTAALGTFGLSASPAAAASGGNSSNEALCLNNGWKTLMRSNKVAFKNEGACVAHAARGGTLVPASTTTGTGAFQGALTTTDPLSQIPYLPNVSGDCFPINYGGLSHFDSYQVTLGEASALTVTMHGLRSGGGTLDNPYLALYSGAFNANDVCATNLLATVDGYNGAQLVSGPLPAGTYTVVALSWYPQYDSRAFGTYELSITAS